MTTINKKKKMRKLLLITLTVMFGFTVNAQVGINTTSPETTLDIVGTAGLTPGALNAVDGITVPIVTDNMTTTSTNGSKVSQLVYSNNVNSTGFYYWNGSSWVALNGGGGNSSGASLGGFTDVDISSNTTIPSSGSAFNLINGVAFASPTITLPATTSAEQGKLITLISTSSPTTTLNLANVAGSNTQLGGGRSGLFISTGSTWVLIVED